MFKKFFLYVVAVTTVIGLTLSSALIAAASTLPLPVNNRLLMVEYSLGAGALRIAQPDTGQYFNLVTPCQSCGAVGGASIRGGFYNQDDGMIYTRAEDVNGKQFQLVKIVGSGPQIGTVSIAGGFSGGSNLDKVYGLAQGGGKVYGIGSALYEVNLSDGSLSNPIPLTGDPSGPDSFGFAFNPFDEQFYVMNWNSGYLYRLNVNTGEVTQVGSTPVPNISYAYSLQIDSDGTFWVLDNSSQVFTFTLNGDVISPAVLQGQFDGSLTATAMILDSPSTTYKVTYKAGNGGSGSDSWIRIPQGSAVTLPSQTACPANNGNPCFVAQNGKTPSGWQVTSGTIASGSLSRNAGQSIIPTSDIILTAQWSSPTLNSLANTGDYNFKLLILSGVLLSFGFAALSISVKRKHFSQRN